MLNWLLSPEFIEIIKNPNILAIIPTAIAQYVIRRIAQPKAYVIWGISHGFSFLIPTDPNNNILLHTRSISVSNVGRGLAKDVEFYFNFLPHHFEIWPKINHSIDKMADNRIVVRFPFLKNGESFTIEMVQPDNSPPDLINETSAKAEGFVGVM